MVWFVAVVLMIFYALGQFFFHADRRVQLLPLVAVVLIAIDYIAARQTRRK